MTPTGIHPMRLQWQTVDVFNGTRAEAEKRDGAVTAAYAGGRCVPVMSGIIELA